MMFAYQPDLLPLSLSEPDRGGEPVVEKTVGLFTGDQTLIPRITL